MSEETLGKQLAAAREQCNLSQSELANRLEVAKYTIHRWEHDLAIPRAYAQRRLKAILGLSESIFSQAKQQKHLRQSRKKEQKDTLTEMSTDILKVYHGWREGTDDDEMAIWETFVEVNGQPLASPGNRRPQYEWGYVGQGPSNLAAAILADCFGEVKDANDRWKTYRAGYYSGAFRDQVIAWLPHKHTDEWWITSEEIAQWLQQQEETRKE